MKVFLKDSDYDEDVKEVYADNYDWKIGTMSYDEEYGDWNFYDNVNHDEDCPNAWGKTIEETLERVVKSIENSTSWTIFDQSNPGNEEPEGSCELEGNELRFYSGDDYCGHLTASSDIDIEDWKTALFAGEDPYEAPWTDDFGNAVQAPGWGDDRSFFLCDSEDNREEVTMTREEAAEELFDTAPEICLNCGFTTWLKENQIEALEEKTAEYERIYGKFRKQAIEKLAKEDMACLLDELCQWLTWVDCHLEVDRK